MRVESRAGVDDAAEVVSAFSQQLGLTGADLRAASAATIKLARTAGGDLAATIDVSSNNIIVHTSDGGNDATWNVEVKTFTLTKAT